MIEAWSKGRLIGAAVLIAGCAAISLRNQSTFSHWPRSGGAAHAGPGLEVGEQILPAIEDHQHTTSGRALRLPVAHLTTPLRLLM
jgi:hypothetical protein